MKQNKKYETVCIGTKQELDKECMERFGYDFNTFFRRHVRGIKPRSEILAKQFVFYAQNLNTETAIMSIQRALEKELNER